MRCPRCNNTDERYFYKGSKGIYCRKCIRFKRTMLMEELESEDYEVNKEASEFELNFRLTEKQKEVSNRVNETIDNRNVLLHCVCGAGKTELVVETISRYLKDGKKVCYAISRKEVVKDLFYRFRKIFKDAKIVALYGGHVKEKSGDLIICTTHQLYRYYKTFDLLVLDEVDAFPLKGNETLLNIAKNSCKGHIIYSTATVDDLLRKEIAKEDYEEIELLFRPGMKPIIVPDVYYLPKFLIYPVLVVLMKKEKNRCIIFVPSKKMCRYLYLVLKNFFDVTYAYSDLEERDGNIESFRRGEHQYIISTSVLERGVTFLDIDVIIIDSIKGVFDESSLVQMTGRVGRNFKNPYGKAIILSSHFSKDISACRKSLERANYELSLLR